MRSPSASGRSFEPDQRSSTKRKPPTLERADAEGDERPRDQEQGAGDDQERRPRRERRLEPGGRAGKREAEPEEKQDDGADEETDPECERHDLPLQLRRRELELEPD